MDWQALRVSLELGFWTLVVLAPLATGLARALSRASARTRALGTALVTLPLVIPPTVLGYYFLVALGAGSPLGALAQAVLGHTLVFTFGGLLLASIVINLPFAVLPMMRGFESVGRPVREAALCCGMTPMSVFRRIELPIAWPGIVAGLVLALANTLGEFGVVLMVGGSIEGETRTLSIAIYDQVQAFDDASAARMAGVLMAVSMVAILTAAWVGRGRESGNGGG